LRTEYLKYISNHGSVIGYSQKEMPEYRFAIVDPGHFHAALVQKEMYPEVSPQVHVYAPLGPDLLDYLARISRFNHRPGSPTRWNLEVHTSPDFLAQLATEKAGNIAVFSGRNRGKIDKILAALEAGFHVLADKPWIIRSEDLPLLERALDLAGRKDLIAYDIMTERYEITSILQRELVNSAGVFGSQEPGTAAEPGVCMESVHHIFKMVAGLPNPRPAWFFDVLEQGEALADVGTHLVDLVQWTLFPDRAIHAPGDVRLQSASRWPTKVSPEQYRAVTGETRDGGLDYYCNTRVVYQLRGVYVKLDVLWNGEAPAAGGDSHLAIYRGTRSRLEIRQGAAEGYRPELYVVPAASGVKTELENRMAELQAIYAGVGMEEKGGEYRMTIPDRYRVGHEAHFAQVTNQFLEYLKHPDLLPAWEKPGMLAKYYTTTAGVELSHQR
jgi:predicted dehydrogenase